MEKILTQIVTITLIFTIGLAHETASPSMSSANSQTVTYNNICTKYIDSDHNGFCDNCGNYHYNNDTCTGYADTDYDGFCDNCGSHHYENGICTDYADTDNDGFCDNCNSHHPASSSGCSGYVDIDNDGICDNHAYGEHCPYAPANTPDNSKSTTSGNYNRRHHSNNGHHGRGHH